MMWAYRAMWLVDDVEYQMAEISTRRDSLGVGDSDDRRLLAALVVGADQLALPPAPARLGCFVGGRGQGAQSARDPRLYACGR